MATFKFTARPGHAVYLGKSLGGRAVFNSKGEFVTDKEAVATILRRSKYTQEVKAAKEDAPTPTPAPKLAKPDEAPSAPEAPASTEAPASPEAPVAPATPGETTPEAPTAPVAPSAPVAPKKPKK